MALSSDPGIAEALGSDGRRALWEPIIGATGAAQPIPADVTTSEHYATADDGAQIKSRWYAKDGATPGPAVLFFHGGEEEPLRRLRR